MDLLTTLSQHAQRRPGREPRRHLLHSHSPCTHNPLNEGRGVNPGDTRAVHRFARLTRQTLNEGRGVNPGDTSGGPAPGTTDNGALNEGRGVNPGDTSGSFDGFIWRHCAQRRPGREPRRHRRRWPSRSPRLNAAQRRPGREPRRHPRRSAGRGGAAAGALNEGRGVNPGDTRSGPLRPLSGALNEGRGVNPGDTSACGCARANGRPLNEGRGVNPGDTGRAVAGHGSACCQQRSTKAGA